MDFRDAYALFLKLNIWLCLHSVLMTGITAFALTRDVPHAIITLALPPLLFYFIYVEDRRNVTRDDEINHPYRTRLVKQSKTTLLYTELAALVSYETLLIVSVIRNFNTLTSQVSVILLGQTPFVVALLYEQLKHIHLLTDSIAVATTWAFTLLYTVLITTPTQLTPDTGAIFLAWFLIVFAGVESRNIQDTAGDEQTNKETLATKLGPTWTKLLEYILKITGVLIFWLTTNTLIIPGMVILHLIGLRTFRYLTTSIGPSNPIPG